MGGLFEKRFNDFFRKRWVVIFILIHTLFMLLSEMNSFVNEFIQSSTWLSTIVIRRNRPTQRDGNAESGVGLCEVFSSPNICNLRS